jgi:hypothetical protein
VSSFEDALQAYRSALAAAAADIGEKERGLFRLLMESAEDIEKRYRLTSDPNMCRILVECENEILGSQIFSGHRIDEARRAYSVLLGTVTPRGK